MKLQTPLLIALAGTVLFGIAPLRATDQTLPSRDPLIVIPLLTDFTSTNRYSDIIRILGKPNFDIGNQYYEPQFKLDNGKSIFVMAKQNGEIMNISLDDKLIFPKKIKQ